MAEYYTVLTTLGENKLANASVTGPRVRPEKVAVGDGGGPSFYDDYGRAELKARTTLVNQRFETTVNDLRTEPDNPNWIVVDGVIPADEGGYNIREVGVIDTDGDLIAIGRFPQTFKPVLASGAFQDMIVRIIMEVADTDSLVLQVDPSAVLATRQFVLDQRRPFVRTPSITSPASGAGALPTSIDVTLTPFAPLYSVDTLDYRRVQVQLAGGDWSAPVADEQIQGDTYTFTADPETQYEARAQDRRQGGPTTPWSDVVLFTTASTYIETPTNTAPADGALDIGETPTLKMSAFNVIGGSDAHTGSRFYVYDVATSTLVHDSGVLGAVEEYTLPENVLEEGATQYEWHGEYQGDVLGWSGRSARTSFTTEDAFLAQGPGPQEMVSYDAATDTGYYGVVPASEVMTGDALASAIGLSAGNSQHSNEGYFKFYVGPNATCWRIEDAPAAGKGYVVFIAKKPYRNDVSWRDIYQAGAVYGVDGNGPDPSGAATNQMTTITVGTSTLKVQLATGAKEMSYSTTPNGADIAEGEDSYWNNLIYRIHADTPTRQVGANWATFSDSDIVVGSGNGRRTWCQESTGSGSTRVYRGYTSLADFYNFTPTGTNSLGWRPALVVIA